MEFQVPGPGTVRIEFIPEVAPVPPPPPPGKVMYGFYQDGNDVVEGKQIETALGKNFAVYRYFASSWGVPSALAKRASEGRLLLWSVKNEDWTNPDFTAIMQEFKAWDRPVVCIFYHEPHDNVNTTTRTASKYVGAYANMVAARVAVGADKVLIGYCGSRSRVVGATDALYPGNIVDVLCHDSYNKIGGVPDRSFKQSWATVLELCERLQKPLIIGEFGCLPGPLPAGLVSRDEWFREAAKYIKEDPLARKWMKGFCYFHALHSSDWRFVNLDGSSIKDGLQGWKEAFVDDPYFVSTPFDPT